MIVLAVDTSSKVASVSILDDGVTRAFFTSNNKQTHSQTIMIMIENILKIADLSIQDIDLFACANGAGSFTGLRIGISAIKGLAFGVNKPSMGISTLEGLAYNCIDMTDAIICPVMDARCAQVYNALFEINYDNDLKSNKLVRMCEDRPIKIEELCEELTKINKKLIFVGDGANLCYNRLIANEIDTNNIGIINDMLVLNSATSIAKIAYNKHTSSEETEVLYPNYLRLSQAEQNL